MYQVRWSKFLSQAFTVPARLGELVPWLVLLVASAVQLHRLSMWFGTPLSLLMPFSPGGTFPWPRGVLGEKRVLATPWSVTALTSELECWQWLWRLLRSSSLRCPAGLNARAGALAPLGRCYCWPPTRLHPFPNNRLLTCQMHRGRLMKLCRSLCEQRQAQRSSEVTEIKECQQPPALPSLSSSVKLRQQCTSPPASHETPSHREKRAAPQSTCSCLPAPPVPGD